MKKLILIVTCAVWCMIELHPSVAQAPDKMSYQAVIRDANNDLISNSTVGLQISILQGAADGTLAYSEIHAVSTNENGLITLEIGTGTTSDDFSQIDWSNGPFFIKTETDPAGGDNYTIEGTSELLSVPYAFHAKTVESVVESDPIFVNSVAHDISSKDTTRWGSSELPVAIDGNIITYDGNNWVAKDLIVKTANTGGGLPVNNLQPYLALNYCIALQGIYPSRNSSEPFIGEIELYGFNFAPRGFATCSGQLLSINQYAALYSLLGTLYGGDARTVFGLPDLRGRVPVSYGNGPGLSDYRIGQEGGSETIILGVSNLPSHNHTVKISFED